MRCHDVKGVYGLLLAAHDEARVGRLGTFRFDGVHLYIGSAQGPGGLEKRIARHRAVASGDIPTRHWHIDYLLGISPRLDVLGAETADPKAECALAQELARRAERIIDGFGASDCRCRSHLFQMPARDEVPLVEAMSARGLHPIRDL